MPLGVGDFVDRREGGEESLGRGLGFEPLLLAFSPADRHLRILDAVVLPEPARPVQVPRIQLIQSCSVRRQTVGRDRLRLDRLVV